ncbi:MAG: sigma 54-dependent Fis family transcriptional regulator [Polyangiaceae bacterium]|nr:sigma 54-dependent Fis family transcriptional regulator [Polyangiaceae bacterium]
MRTSSPESGRLEARLRDLGQTKNVIVPSIEPDTDAITEILTVGDRLVLRTKTLGMELLAGPCAGQRAQLAGPEIRVGSGPGMDLVLLDGAISRHHLTIRLERQGIRVVDMRSRNGTLLDGVRIVEAYARHGSTLTLGASTLRLSVASGTTDLPISSRDRFGALLGKSSAMRQVFTVLERIAPTAETVLVEGETGTGKELAAEAIHEESPRSAGPFVVFDCSAVAGSLVESELFGHVRGAFTGAVADRQGAFEAADGGTLFLDEIGELPIDLQPKLLRVLEKLELKRVGSNAVRKVDVRVVAATNRNLAEECQRGRFREDLLYRLAVVRVVLPPLRQRPDDIEMLARHFADTMASRAGRPVELSEAALKGLRSRAYPGNVRELRNAVARTLSLGDPDASTFAGAQPVEPSPFSVDLSLPFMESRERLVESFERAYLRAALDKTGGNATKAAEQSGLNRKFIQRAIAKYGLRS